MANQIFDSSNPLTDEIRQVIVNGSHDIPTVLSKSSCPQCDATQRTLIKKGLTPGVDFRVVKIDIEPHSDMYEHARTVLNASAAPVVVFAGDVFAGFRPDRLTALTSKVITQANAAA